jgi:hypothetical protein
MRDDRGVSTPLNYTLSLAIATVLVVGLLLAGGTFVEDQREGAVDTELRVIGQRLAADIATADRMVQRGAPPSETNVTTRLPTRVAGSTYNIEVRTAGGNVTLRLTATEVDRSVIVPVANRTAVAATTISDNDVRVRYDPTADQLEVIDA